MPLCGQSSAKPNAPPSLREAALPGAGRLLSEVMDRKQLPAWLWTGRGLFTLALLGLAAGTMVFFTWRQFAGLRDQPMRTAIFGIDESYYFWWLRSAWFERPFDIRESAQQTGTMPPQEVARLLAGPRTATGKLPNKYGVGWALAGAPFYALADLGVATARAAGWKEVVRDGHGPAYQTALVAGQLGYALAGLLLAWRIARRWVPDPWALEGVLLCWLGSFLVAYQTFIVTMAHNTAFFALAWAAWAALRVREGRAGPLVWAQLGLAAGLAVATRYQTAVYLLFPAWAAGGALLRGGRAAWTGAACAAAAAALPLLLQMAAWKVVYGQWLVYSYGGEGFHWLRPKIGEVLFSPFHGLFHWSPALLLGLAGWVAWARRHPVPGWLWMASFLATLWVNTAWHAWWFGAAYGARAFEGSVLFFMAGTAWLLARAAARPAGLAGVRTLLVLGAVFNLVLAHQVYFGHLSAEKPVTYLDIWRSLGF